MASGTATARIGIDVGGTFTDLVLHDAARDITHTGKLLTTPDDPSRAIIDGTVRLLEETGLTPADLHSVIHGTTLVTNTIIERTGATVGLLTTEGFRDSIEIGRETRYDLYDLFLETPTTLVPRRRRLEVPERIGADGDVLLPLDEAAVATAARRLVEEEKVEAIAVAFLHSYRDARHEKRAGAVINALYPALPLSLSAEVAPEIREYERASTACANAYVQPLMARYLDRVEAALIERGFHGRLYIMLSGGGITTVREAKAYPIRLIESGPAAGAMASSFIARMAGLERVVSFDMGGTTAKMCLVEGYEPNHKFDFEAGRVRRFQKGSGLPLKVSVVDMIEIGAGGGSLARVDPASGLMKVGPRSAGAMPGPVCYGRGGTEPAVTDADLVLGRLDPAYFLGGEMKLDPDRVTRAFAERISAKIGVDAEQAALGVQRIVDETMAAATRMHLAEKGKDPRRFTMIAFGGAGPVHAWNLARLLKMRRVVVPLGAGVASALGFLVAPPATDMVRSHVARLERLDWDAVSALFAEMAAEGRALLTEAGAAEGAISFRPVAEMRHVGQGFEIPVPLPSMSLSAADLPVIREAFFAAYRDRFERSMEDSPIEALSWRLACAAPGQHIDLGGAVKTKPGTGGAVPRATRRVLFEGVGWQDCPVYDRYALAPGAAFAGPALVEERESTCVVGPGSKVHIDRFLNLVMDLE
ncbi:hydantoinase/oxoprolinase family protein [Roseomonas hellenica]|uniref:Hydantoinase/oxoprolinase family protein n=1 Tax=Plastoroseomonas hellenica TaxID=2687306 RepID=A0ABS5ER84_9PROT|nr:hydantoinase/oxoprolinase family protein [Plastoroseomonas hellenica]MBR0662785.1 hydantoinase/oxoprolinase family protein [Plastoroseomonas hellenica]